MIIKSIKISFYVLIINTILMKCSVHGVKKLTILHVNDMHARFEETNVNSAKCSKFEEKYGRCYGGFARLTSAAKIYRKKAEEEGRSVIFLNAGDVFQGSLYYNFFKAQVVSNLTPMLHLDAMCLGNHEFDDGPENLGEFVNNVSFPIVSCNTDTSQEPSLKNVKKSTMLTVKGMKIGIVGYILPKTKTTSTTGKVKFSDEVPCVRKEAKKLKTDGADIVIALGHSGIDMDETIARSVDHVDVVIGGHTNTFLYNGDPPSIERPMGPYPILIHRGRKRIPVVQAYAYTKYLGVLNIDFDDKGNMTGVSGNPVLLNSSIPMDPEVEKYLQPWKEKIDVVAKEELGVTKVFLDGSTNTHKEESNLANMITDAFIDHYMGTKMADVHRKKGWTDTSIAIIQAGGIRSSINATTTGGVITYADVVLVLPFMDQVVRLSITGRKLLEAFEWSVATYELGGGNFEGGFLQVSGLKVVYDVSKPIGERVVSLKARCTDCYVPRYKDVDGARLYNILMSRYLANGGDGFDMFADCIDGAEGLDEIDTNIVMQYIKKKSPVYPGIEGRIFIKGSATILHAISSIYLIAGIVLLFDTL